MFDTVAVWGECPQCKAPQTFMAQTKDLDNEMSNYEALAEDWETGELRRAFRKDMPVFPKFPFDKEHTVWADQAERIEAAATIPLELHGQLNFVKVVATCEKCHHFFRGTIKVEDGKLIGPIVALPEEKDA